MKLLSIIIIISIIFTMLYYIILGILNIMLSISLAFLDDYDDIDEEENYYEFE